VDLSIFAMQLCLRHDPTVSAALAPLLARGSDRPSPGELWNLWTAAARQLAGQKRWWLSGCWDFWDDTAKANKMYPDWADGLMIEKGARAEPSGAADPYRGAERYMTVTMACLMQRGTASERSMAAVCDIPEAYLWHRATFDRLLGGISNINFASVERAVLYVVPRDDDWSLTPDDLRLPKFEHLRPIV
jgi:hypothetical protein